MKPRVLAAAALAAAIAGVGAQAAPAATYSVLAGSDDPPGAPKRTEPNTYFSRTVTIHTGDSVRWTFRGFHTVTFPARGTRPPALAAPDPATPVTGASDASGAPLWFNGQPTFVVPANVAGPAGGTTVDGSRYVNSGVPAPTGPPQRFTARFTRRGSYTYYCIVHPGMKGVVRVVGRGARAPSPAAARAAARRELAAAVARARAIQRRRAPSGPTVEVGRTGGTISLNRFYPATKTVRAGQPVTFTMAGQNRNELHTVTFGPEGPQLEQTFFTPRPDGSGVLNPVATYPSDPPPALPPYTGSNHGDGFLNSGLLDNQPTSPLPVSTSITFTSPGTYQYECVIHRGMDGRITVVP